MIETIQAIQGELVVMENKGININAGGNIGDISGLIGGNVSGVVNLGEIWGDVTNAINQLPNELVLGQPNLKELLTQLESAIATTPDLPEADKVEALQQIKILAAAGQNPTDPAANKTSKTALKILRGTTADLSEGTALVQACTELLPAIANLLSTLSNKNTGASMNQNAPDQSILMLAANPKGTTALRLGEEARELQTGLERSRGRDRFILHQRWAVTATDVRRALLDCKPTIVHFSGHGVGTERSDPDPSASRKFQVVDETTAEVEGLMFENEIGQPQLVSTEALADLFALFAEHIECVVLNACFSEAQADAISHHIPYVVGMKRAIGDRAAIQFTTGFYDALLAGEPVEFAYRLGCNAIQLEGIPEHLTPTLKPQRQ